MPFLRSISAALFLSSMAIGVPGAWATAPAAPTETRVIENYTQLGIDTPTPRFAWIVNDADRDERQTAWQIQVADSESELAGGITRQWDSGKVSSAQQFGIPYAGIPLRKTSEYWWRVRTWDKDNQSSPWSPARRFVTAFFGKSDWKPECSWIRHPGALSELTNVPVLLRKEFALSKSVKHAFLFISGLGQFVAVINGKNVGNHEIDPAWSDYDRTVYYVTFDVTNQLSKGNNALGVMLSNGWFNAKDNLAIRPFGVMRAKAQLHVEYVDGTSEEIVSDSTWKTNKSPYVSTEIHGAEHYDARLVQPGWDLPGFDDVGWMMAVPEPENAAKLLSQNAPPVVAHEITTFANVRTTGPNTYVFDLGRNINGQFEITVSGRAGAVVSLLPGEALNADGTIKGTRAPGASYTLKGGPTETWRLAFSSIGFRYLQVSGATQDPSKTELPCIRDIKGYSIYTGAKSVGTFHASDERYNQIHDLALRTYQSNLVSIHTDGPNHEKLGWQEVAWISLPSTTYRFDLLALYKKICRDLRDAQRESGLVPNIAPNWFHSKSAPPGDAFDDAPAWGGSMFHSPWLIYQSYGDRTILEENYGAMQAYIAYLNTRKVDGLVVHGLGDWMAPAGSPVANVEGAIYVYDLHVMRDVATVLGKSEDVVKYAHDYARARADYNKAYFDPATQSYKPMNQTNQAIPLALGIVPDGSEAAVVKALANDIAQPQENGFPPSYGKAGDFGRVLPYHVTSGDIGVNFLWRALSDAGLHDLIQTMITQPTEPSYLNMILNNETSLTENWRLENARSHNHDMYGGILEWFYRGIAGISALKPGFEQIQIKPGLPTGLHAAEATYDSVRGRISSAWEINGSHFTLRTEIPPNTTAIVYVPANEKSSVKESGLPVDQVPAVRFLRNENSKAVFEVGSGRYLFESQLPETQ